MALVRPTDGVVVAQEDGTVSATEDVCDTFD